MATIEFEEELHKKLGNGRDGEVDLKEQGVKIGRDGKVTVQGSSMAELRDKYGNT